jgi:hypothetical protein
MPNTNAPTATGGRIQRPRPLARLRARLLAPTRRRRADRRYVLLVISHRHGDDYTLTASERDAFAHLYAYVQDWWSCECDRGAELPTKIPQDPEEAIGVYFEAVGESWSTEPIAPAPPPSTQQPRALAEQSS